MKRLLPSMKHIRIALVSTIILALAGCANGGGLTPVAEPSSDGKPGAGTARSAMKAASRVPGPPFPEQVQSIPAVRKGSESLLVIYRHTAHGFAEAHGYDTLVYRFASLPGGWLTGATVSERRLDGERRAASYTFARAGAEIIVTEAADGSSRELGTIRPVGTGWQVSGERDGRVYVPGSDGTLEIRSLAGNMLERWSASPSSASPGAELADAATGKYSFPDRQRIDYLQRKRGDDYGVEDVGYSIWKEKGDAYRARAEGVEAIGEVYVDGLDAALSGDRALENLALLELTLGSGRPLRPLLAAVLADGAKKP